METLQAVQIITVWETLGYILPGVFFTFYPHCSCGVHWWWSLICWSLLVVIGGSNLLCFLWWSLVNDLLLM